MNIFKNLKAQIAIQILNFYENTFIKPPNYNYRSSDWLTFHNFWKHNAGGNSLDAGEIQIFIKLLIWVHFTDSELENEFNRKGQLSIVRELLKVSFGHHQLFL